MAAVNAVHDPIWILLKPLILRRERGCIPAAGIDEDAMGRHRGSAEPQRLQERAERVGPATWIAPVRRQHAQAIVACTLDCELAEVFACKLPPRLAVFGDEGIEIDERGDPFRRAR